jgi:phosphoribosylformimino-5-aminoimidazole carboxamide ribotide isomerase
MQIIPAVDIMDGKCVRLTEGDFTQKIIYHDDPLEAALKWEGCGITRLHLVDLDGARTGAVSNWKALEQIATRTSLQIDFGGGINNEAALQRVFNSGATWATIGSIAVKEETTFTGWIKMYGADKFLLAADVLHGMIKISGWQQETAWTLDDFLEKYIHLGIQQVFCTDISKDGRLEGPSFDLYQNILKNYPDLYLIASGGVSGIEDLVELQNVGCKAAIVGKAIYEQKISMQEITQFISK